MLIAVFSLQMSWPVVLSGLATQEPLEGLPEFRAEYCVDDGVECGIEAAQPPEKVDQRYGEIAVWYYCHQQSHYEEWQPTSNKGSSDDCQRFGSFSLPFGFE